MRRSAPAWILLFALLSGVVHAESASLELATARGCFICHSIDPASGPTPPLAPAYRDIADRYRGRDDGRDYLVGRVLHGTVYSDQNWQGRISMRFMPPNLNVSRLEAAELVSWILKLPSDPRVSDRLRQHEQMLVLSTTSGCMSCHRMDKSGDARLMPLAPALREIAARYASQPDARRKLLRSVRQGTRAADKLWPETNMQFMPPNVALADADAEALVDWILGLQP